MAQNIEIKAQIKNIEQVNNHINSINFERKEKLYQIDIFYNIKTGRLKLRTINSMHHELIFYYRKNKKGPKKSYYFRIPIKNSKLIDKSLSKILGIKGIVKKSRIAHINNNLRVHIDNVDHLGHFLEIESIVSTNNQQAFEKLNTMLKNICISNDDLVKHAYIDLLNN